RSSGGDVALEPLEGAYPAVLCGGGLVLRALVAMEVVAGRFVAHDLVLDGRGGELGAQALDVVHRNRRVDVAEEPEPGCAHRLDLADERRELREPGRHDPTAVEADRGAEPAADGHQEGHAPAE